VKHTYIKGERVEFDFKRGDMVKHGDVTGEVRQIRGGVVYVMLDALTKRGNRRLAAYLPNDLVAVAEA
jgi:hypothetical protein